DLPRDGDLRFPRRACVGERHVGGDVEGAVVSAVDPRQFLRGQHTAEPVAFTSAMWCMRPCNVNVDGGAHAVHSCSGVRPSALGVSVARWKSSQFSSMVRASAMWGGVCRSVVMAAMPPCGTDIFRAHTERRACSSRGEAVKPCRQYIEMAR